MNMLKSEVLNHQNLRVEWKSSAYEHGDSHQHHFEERAVFVGCGVRAVGTNESNTYRRTERKNTVLRGANQYSRTQPITCRKWRFLNSRGAVGRLENGFSAIHTNTNVAEIAAKSLRVRN